MKAPQKTGFKVNGKLTSLENYFLNVIDRPLPKPPTHYVVAEVLNTDLSIKRVTIYFNPGDNWKGSCSYEQNSAQGVGLAIGEGLVFLNLDPNTLAYKFWIIEIATGEKIWDSNSIYLCTKCEL